MVSQLNSFVVIPSSLVYTDGIVVVIAITCKKVHYAGVVEAGLRQLSQLESYQTRLGVTI